MKTILAFLVTTGLLATATRADVIIYRGVGTITADAITGAPFPKSLNIYLVVNYGSGQYGTLSYGLIGGSKRFSQGAASTHDFASVPFPKGRTASVISRGGSNSTSPTIFSHGILYFRGFDKTLLVRKSPIAVTASRPNALKGLSTDISRNGSDATFSEQHYGLTFQGTATIKANNANQTIDQVVDVLAAGLIAKGFTSL